MRLCHALALALIIPFAPAVPAGEPASTYLGQEEREIKALSAGDIDAYLSGQGMGLARAAELNGYPGPAHVLELAAELGLSRDQLERTQALHASMRSRAVELGRQLVAEERNLDRLFASGAVTPERLSASLAAMGELQARLRGVHLEAHLTQAGILDPEQMVRYAELRGYRHAAARPAPHPHRH
ncbi:MAG: hypothetical protein DIU62_000350 [Pseudomonadota bacterium]|jgi:Spy/CpxP family protein refolding chaperone|nr:MAG: hypothetical protein DIU62_03415 [Pseudomonadota bacterium]